MFDANFTQAHMKQDVKLHGESLRLLSHLGKEGGERADAQHAELMQVLTDTMRWTAALHREQQETNRLLAALVDSRQP